MGRHQLLPLPRGQDSGTFYNFIGVIFEIPGAHPRPPCIGVPWGVLIRAAHLKFSKDKLIGEKTNFGRLAAIFQICSMDADILSFNYIKI